MEYYLSLFNPYLWPSSPAADYFQAKFLSRRPDILEQCSVILFCYSNRWYTVDEYNRQYTFMYQFCKKKYTDELSTSQWNTMNQLVFKHWRNRDRERPKRFMSQIAWQSGRACRAEHKAMLPRCVLEVRDIEPTRTPSAAKRMICSLWAPGLVICQLTLTLA